MYWNFDWLFNRGRGFFAGYNSFHLESGKNKNTINLEREELSHKTNNTFIDDVTFEILFFDSRNKK